MKVVNDSPVDRNPNTYPWNKVIVDDVISTRAVWNPDVSSKRRIFSRSKRGNRNKQVYFNLRLSVDLSGMRISGFGEHESFTERAAD